MNELVLQNNCILGGDYYKDSFSRVFKNETEFISFLKESAAEAEWISYPANEITFYPLERSSPLLTLAKETKKGDIFNDTLLNLGLAAKVGESFFSIRDIAFKSIKDRVKIGGKFLNYLSIADTAEILNKCFAKNKDKTLVLVSGSKISAMHADRAYSILDMYNVFYEATSYLESNYPGYKFLDGYYEHAQSTALWSLGEKDNLVSTYKEALQKHGITGDYVEPAVRVTTSDIGISGANIFPILMHSSSYRPLPLGSPLKLNHKYNATIEDFKENLNKLFAHYQKTIGGLTKLFDIEIQHPVRCMGEIMRDLKLPKKASLELIELFKISNGDQPCSAYVIYFSISSILNQLKFKGLSGNGAAAMEENIARAIKFKWDDYDLPGDFIW